MTVNTFVLVCKVLSVTHSNIILGSIHIHVRSAVRERGGLFIESVLVPELEHTTVQTSLLVENWVIQDLVFTIHL